MQYNDSRESPNGVTRRHFVKIAGITAVGVSSIGFSDFLAKGVTIILDPSDIIAGSAPSLWAAKELEDSLTSKGIIITRIDQLSKTKADDLIILVAGASSKSCLEILKSTGINIPAVPEALGLVPSKVNGKQVLLTCGHDTRGLVYALLELNDRVQNSGQALDSLKIEKPVIEKPANKIRSLNRLFVSDIEDKPWYNDREMWPKYLTMATTQRFNRFNLSFGIAVSYTHLTLPTIYSV